jgi:hypothetical protein
MIKNWWCDATWEMRNKCVSHKVTVIGFTICFFMIHIWALTWPHQGAILENNVPFQICNGPFQISNEPQLRLVKLRASLRIDKYPFLDLYGLCIMKKQIVKPITVTLWLTHLFLISHVASHHQFLIIELILHPRLQHEIYTTAQD